MSTARLRIFPHVGDDQTGKDEAVEPVVTVKLSEFLPVIKKAHQERRTWLRDFEDDEVCVTSDLYQVLQAFSAL